jgi:hypothetical protein
MITKSTDASKQAHDAAQAYLAAGLSVIPVRTDGSKAAAVKWEPYCERLATDSELQKWYGNGKGYGVAVLGGKVSGNVEHTDFDYRAGSIYPAWCALVEERAPGLLFRLSHRKTPRKPEGGYHVSYRCREAVIPGNTPIARAPNPDNPSKPVVMIETRGEGGYVLAPGTPGHCHPSGGQYVHHRGLKLSQVEDITAAEREILWDCARSFDEMPPEETDPTDYEYKGDGTRPGDEYNANPPSFRELMEPKGYRFISDTHVKRPGKDEPGWSGTAGIAKNKRGVPLYSNFSANDPYLPAPTAGRPCSSHEPFAVYAYLYHGGDFSAAAKELAARGLGKKKGGPVRLGKSAVTANFPARRESDVTSPLPADEIHLTDKGNAKRMVKRHGADLRHCFPWKKWLVWDGRRWIEDETGEVVRRVKETQASLFRWIADEIKKLSESEDEDDGGQGEEGQV